MIHVLLLSTEYFITSNAFDVSNSPSAYKFLDYAPVVRKIEEAYGSPTKAATTFREGGGDRPLIIKRIDTSGIPGPAHGEISCDPVRKAYEESLKYGEIDGVTFDLDHVDVVACRISCTTDFLTIFGHGSRWWRSDVRLSAHGEYLPDWPGKKMSFKVNLNVVPMH
ncbi:hypothetical protein BDN70DRAFT_889941 [Pholiota conissans]|uniref:Uncharacterized protein n=1 Tax=Pholiota conissans TaxID=109636 RepID=A0A9P5ZCC5_9AGAR|nr:hypothetical protein BDN70DRAFT_889941 [Pholiota conissans]